MTGAETLTLTWLWTPEPGGPDGSLGRTPAAADGGGEAPAAGEGQKRGFPVQNVQARDRNAGGTRTLARNASVSRHLSLSPPPPAAQRGNTWGHKQDEGSLLLLFQSENRRRPILHDTFPPASASSPA